MNRVWVVLAFVSLSPLLGSVAEQCGKQANYALCPNGLCCSEFGYCGTTELYCSAGCQSQCWAPPPPYTPPPPSPSPPPPPPSSDAQCGKEANNTLCPNGLCCSEYGYCGSTELYCSSGCQSQCWAPPPPVTPPPPPPPFVPPPPGWDVGSIVNSSVFEEMLKYKDSSSCHAPGFYTYDAFITAANAFSEFGNTGNDEARRTELAAFFGQTSHETTGGGGSWNPPDGPFFWGYCYKEEITPPSDYCNPSEQYPCVAGKSYHGRGPMQLSYNVNYGQAGEALGVDLLSNPELVATDPVISFKTAIWFWMTAQAPKPSCHAVMIGAWTPSDNDLAARRYPGYGLTTNIINGGLECGRGPDSRVDDRIGFYKRYCDMLGVSYRDHLDCSTMTPYGLTLGNLYLRIKQRLGGLWSL